MIRMTTTTMVTMFVPLICYADLPVRSFSESKPRSSEKAREKQQRDYHQDDHHQDVH